MAHRSSSEFKRIVLAALVITLGGVATARTPAGQFVRSDARSRTGLPSVLHEANENTSPQIPDVTVTTPSPPTERELAGDNLYQFIVQHATTRYMTTSTTRNLARWRGGRQSLCPRTSGLDPTSNAYVTARLRALAAYVGAPVQSNPRCKDNVQILFTSNPKQAMDAVLNWATATSTFGIRYAGGTRDLLTYRDDQPIQGWYITTRGGAMVLNTDLALVGLDVRPLWPRLTENYRSINTVGSRLGGSSGSGIGIGMVILIVDTRKVPGYSVGTLADYLAMLTLTVVQSPDHCNSLPSILDLMSSSCSAREKPVAMTAGDLAFLKALYYRDTGWGPSISRASIHANMMRQFELHSGR